MKITTVLVTLLVVPCLAVAQGYTPAEQAEIDAANASQGGPPVYGPPQSLPEGPGPEATIYFSDFESDNGGLAGTLDWEWGVYMWSGAGCGYTPTPPPAAYSGTSMWGTILNDCYSNSGNGSTCTNDDIRDDSILSLSADLTGYVTATLTWWEWLDMYTDWDFVEIYVNGVQVHQYCPSGYTPSTAWTQNSVDLTPFVGLPVSIEFHEMATTVVERAGWYIDDLEISGDPIPVELMSLTVE